MAVSRRQFVAGSGASLSALALLRVLPASAADQFQEALLPSADEMWSAVKFVNNTMGPTRLTGSPQQSAFVQYLKDQLTNILHPAGGSVFEETFANYPRWTAKSWALFAGSREISTIPLRDSPRWRDLEARFEAFPRPSCRDGQMPA